LLRTLFDFSSIFGKDTAMLLQPLGKTVRYLLAYAIACLLFGLAGCATQSPMPSTGSSSTTAVANTVTSGPTLGYAWDKASGGLRPIVGLPGAAYLGAPVFSSGTYSTGIACAQKKLALLTGGKGEIYVVNLPAGNPVELTGQLSAKQQIVFSPGCVNALVYAADTSTVFLLQGVSTAPTVKTVQLASSRSVVGAAVADSGAILVASSQSGGGVSVDGVRADGSSAPSIASLSGYGGLAFLPNVDNALIVDAAKNILWLQSGLVNGTGLTQIAAAGDGLTQPSAVGSSADSRYAIVLNNQSSILRIDISKKSAPVSVACNCSPSELVPLSGNLVFRLNEVGVDTLWAFDGDAPSSRVVFIPGIKHLNPTGAAQ
jgi:hypothetical protein